MNQEAVDHLKALYSPMMTEDEQQTGHDLVTHAMAKIKMAVHDFIELMDHPAQAYMLNMQGLQLFMNGMAAFALVHADTLEDAERENSERTKFDRIMTGTMMGVLLTLANAGSPECEILYHRVANHEQLPDWREMMKFISKVKFKEQDRHPRR